MVRLIALSVAAISLLLHGCVVTANTQVAESQASASTPALQYKRVALAVVTNSKFSQQYVGFTVFNNWSVDEDFSKRAVDDAIEREAIKAFADAGILAVPVSASRERIRSVVSAVQRVGESSVFRDTWGTLRPSLLPMLGASGVDAVVLITHQGPSAYPLIVRPSGVKGAFLSLFGGATLEMLVLDPTSLSLIGSADLKSDFTKSWNYPAEHVRPRAELDPALVVTRWTEWTKTAQDAYVNGIVKSSRSAIMPTLSKATSR